MAAGLAHLHHHGVIHRDLKPSNVLWVRDAANRPTMKLADFGISKDLDLDRARDEYTLTASGAGTAGYMAREFVVLRWTQQRQKKRLRRGDFQRGDVFALGCCLFFLLTGGRHPFGDYPCEYEMRIMQGARPELGHIPAMPRKRHVLAKALVEAMVQHDAAARPSAKTVLNHAFFSFPG